MGLLEDCSIAEHMSEKIMLPLKECIIIWKKIQHSEATHEKMLVQV